MSTTSEWPVFFAEAVAYNVLIAEPVRDEDNDPKDLEVVEGNTHKCNKCGFTGPAWKFTLVNDYSYIGTCIRCLKPEFRHDPVLDAIYRERPKHWQDRLFELAPIRRSSNTTQEERVYEQVAHRTKVLDDSLVDQSSLIWSPWKPWQKTFNQVKYALLKILEKEGARPSGNFFISSESRRHRKRRQEKTIITKLYICVHYKKMK